MKQIRFDYGMILKNLGKLKEAELSTSESLELYNHLARTYTSLSNLQHTNESERWKDQLFSESILNINLQKNQVNIYSGKRSKTNTILSSLLLFGIVEWKIEDGNKQISLVFT
tara:strand:- start:81 stop:419 length:339 start_codon:yes stop_codon:yes gene_type:complete